MSFWGNIGDRFTQGYALGERMRENRLKREEADAAQAYFDAEQAGAAIPEETPEYVSGMEQMSTDPRQSGALDLEKGVSKEYGGRMGDKGVAENALPSGAMGSRFITDPKQAKARFENENRLYRAMAARDPMRAFQTREFLSERRRKEAKDAIGRAIMAQEMGDERGASEALLHSVNLINDGNNMQVRRVNGQLVGVSYDDATGKYIGAVPITTETMSMFAKVLDDPASWHQMQRDNQLFEMQQKQHDLSMRTGEQQLEQQAQLFPEQLRGLQLGNKTAQFKADHMEEDYALDREFKKAQITTMRLTGRANLARALAGASYYGSGGARGSRSGKTPDQATQDRVNSLMDDYESTLGEDTLQSRWINEGAGAGYANAGTYAARLVSDNVDADGRELDPRKAISVGHTIGMLEDMAAGSFKPSDDESNRLFEELVGQASISEKGANGTPSIQIPIDGVMYTLDQRLTPALANHVLESAKDVEKNSKPGSAENEEARSIIRILTAGVVNVGQALADPETYEPIRFTVDLTDDPESGLYDTGIRPEIVMGIEDAMGD